MQTYTVRRGDTLSKIAQQVYGDASQWRRIFEANRDRISDPDRIRVGQTLLIPDLGGGDGTTGGDGQVGGYVFPVEGYTGRVDLHWGSYPGASDLFAPQGTPVVAMCGGRVGRVGTAATDRYGGNNVEILGSDGCTYYYAHGDREPQVARGTTIPAGQLLFGVGDTGNAQPGSYHLHIGIGYGIQEGSGPTGGAGINFNAVELLRRVQAGSAVHDRPRRSGRYRVVGTGHLDLNVRDNPSHSATILATLDEGAVVAAEESIVEAEGRAWRRIRDPIDGWVADQFLAPLEAMARASRGIAAAPSSKAEARAGRAAVQTYIVRRGDTLWKIAEIFYGDGRRWPRIFEANRDRITDPDRIRVGQRLVIPDAETGQEQGPDQPAGVFSKARLYELVRRHGAGRDVDRIMVAAALTESGGNPSAVGDGGHSAGLWQMHDRGLGAGMTVAERCNPDTACKRMLPEFNRWYEHWTGEGETGEELAVRTYLWTERPRGYKDSASPAAMRFRRKWQEAES